MSYPVGSTVSGVVSGVTDYGAFVRLEDGSTGMIHISKLSRDFISDIHSVIKKGDDVTATVISDKEGKLALSLIGDSPKKRAEGFGFRPQKEFNDFEAMLSSFKSVSEEKLAGVSRRDKKKRR